MKKVLIGLFSLLSLSALADGYNVYVKGEVNVLGGVTMNKDLFNHFQAGLGDKLDKACNLQKPWFKGYNLGLEVTKDINETIEVGLGVEYKINK